jgi:hypothetical protein
MINGADHWDDHSAYYVQSNNAVERILSRYGADVSTVTCGPSAAVNCLAAMGHNVETATPSGWQPQPEDVLTLWFHDPRNWAQLARVRTETDPAKSKHSPHEVPQYYPAAVRGVFGVRADFEWGMDFDKVAEYVRNGLAVMLNHKPDRSRSGHFVAIVAHDNKADDLIYHDSWPEGIPGHDGWAVRIARDRFNEFERYGVIFKELLE